LLIKSYKLCLIDKIHVGETKRKPAVILQEPSVLVPEFQAYRFVPFWFSPNH